MTVFNADTNAFARAPQPGSVDDALVYFVRDLRMRMPLAQLLTTRLPTSGPSVCRRSITSRPSTSRRTTHHVAGRTDAVDFQYWITEGPRPLPLRVVLTYVGESGQPQFRANFSGVEHEPGSWGDVFKFRIPLARTRSPSPPRYRSPPDPRNRRRHSRRSSHDIDVDQQIGRGRVLAALVLVFLPVDDAFAAGRAAGVVGRWQLFQVGSGGQREHVAGPRSFRRSRCVDAFVAALVAATGSSAERQGSRDENQGERQDNRSAGAGRPAGLR